MIVVTDGVRVPLKSWAVNVEDGALEQARNLANLPFAIHHVALMPDAHQGYGMPIGGVLFADMAVVPYAVGVDIGCGVMLIETSLTMDAVREAPDLVGSILRGVQARVPVGNGPQAQHQSQPDPFEFIGALPMSARTVAVVVGAGGGSDRQSAEVSVIDGHIWMTFLGPRGGRQYTLPLAPQGASDLGALLRAAASAAGFDHDKSAVPLNEYPRTIAIDRDKAVCPGSALLLVRGPSRRSPVRQLHAYKRITRSEPMTTDVCLPECRICHPEAVPCAKCRTIIPRAVDHANFDGGMKVTLGGWYGGTIDLFSPETMFLCHPCAEDFLVANPWAEPLPEECGGNSGHVSYARVLTDTLR